MEPQFYDLEQHHLLPSGKNDNIIIFIMDILMQWLRDWISKSMSGQITAAQIPLEQFENLT